MCHRLRLAHIVSLAVVAMALVVLSAPSAALASGSKALVFGSQDNGYEGDNVAATLAGLGYDVDRLAALPADLSPYSSIWYIEAYKGLTVDEQAELSSYVAAGGSAYLTGERPCCETLNASIKAILDSVLTNQDVTVGGLGDIAGPFTFNGGAADGVALQPNTLVDFVPQSPGGMAGLGGIASRNVFATSADTPVGAIFDESDMQSGKGRIALLMDIDWLGDAARGEIIENIQNFLDKGTGCSNDGPADDPAFAWTGNGGPSNCTTLITPSTVTWGATSSAGPVSFQVSATGVTAECNTTPVTGGAVEVCNLSDAASTASLVVTASDSLGTVTRRYHVQPQNDVRNVPAGYSADSNWWDWPDSDGDGIPNYWEENGVWVGDQYLNLPALGADPAHKDLFLRYDFAAGSELSDGTFSDMKSAFAAAPLSNPDGVDGVNLHIERGASVPKGIVGDFTLNKPDIQKVATYSGFAGGPEIGGNGVPQIFHWLLNFSTTGSNVIGLSYIQGGFGYTAFPISGFEAALNVNQLPGSAGDFVQASNAVHEFGHQLGLLHHGATSTPTNDPTYKSVMSYAYSNFGIPGGLFGLSHRIDYSRTTQVNLDWRQGPGLGALTFIGGQYGEDPAFYSTAANQVIDTSQARPQELTGAEALQQASADAVRAFVQDLAPEATPDIPTLADKQVSVAAGHQVDVPLGGTDPAGKPLSYVITGDPVNGTAEGTVDGIKYSSSENTKAERDSVIVRAYNGTFSSDPAVVTIDIVRPSAAAATSGGDAAPGQAPSAGGSTTKTSGWGLRLAAGLRTPRLGQLVRFGWRIPFALDNAGVVSAALRVRGEDARRLHVKRPYTIASGNVRAQAGLHRALVLHVSKRVARPLLRARRLRAQLTLSVGRGAGATTVTRSVLLRH